MKIKINGEFYSFDKELTILELLKELNLIGKPVVVEHNGDIVIKENYDKINVLDGDSFELVTFVGGG